MRIALRALCAGLALTLIAGCGEPAPAGSGTAADNPAMQTTRDFMAALNAHDVDRLSTYIDDKFVDHNAMPGYPAGKTGCVAMFKDYVKAFPDVHAEMDLMFAQGDWVAMKFTTTGTSQGAFMGMPATQKKIKMDEVHLLRIVNGKCVEHYGLEDDMTMMHQMGLMPEPEAPAKPQ